MSEIDIAVEGVKKDVEYIRERIDEHLLAHKTIDERVRKLEDWKLIFVAKFTTYSTFALVIGSFSAQLLIKLITKWL